MAINPGSKIKMRVTLNCDICSSKVIEQITDDPTSCGQWTRTKTGNHKFMGRVITGQVECPGCHSVVIKPYVKGKVGHGCFGSISMTLVQDKAPTTDPQPTGEKLGSEGVS